MQIIRKCITDLKFMNAVDLFENGKSGLLESGVGTPFRNLPKRVSAGKLGGCALLDIVNYPV